MEVVKKSKWKRNLLIGLGLFIAIFITLGLLVDEQTQKRYSEQAAMQKSQDSNIVKPYNSQFPSGPLMASLIPKRGIDGRKKETKKPFNVPALFSRNVYFVNSMCGKPFFTYMENGKDSKFKYQRGRYILTVGFDEKTKKANDFFLSDTISESFEIKELLKYNNLSKYSTEYSFSPSHSTYDEKIVTYNGVDIIPRSARAYGFGKRQQALMRE